MAYITKRCFSAGLCKFSFGFLLLKLTEVTSTREFIYMKTLYRYLGDVTSVKFNSKKVFEDEIFGRQDILQFFSGESKDYKYVKFPQRL